MDKHEDYCIEGYERLAAAVVEQAAKDYKSALQRLERKPFCIEARKMLNDCERFFKNEIAMYSDIDGEAAMKAIRESVRQEARY